MDAESTLNDLLAELDAETKLGRFDPGTLGNMSFTVMTCWRDSPPTPRARAVFELCSSIGAVVLDPTPEMRARMRAAHQRVLDH